MAKASVLPNVSFGSNKDTIFSFLSNLNCPLLTCSFENNYITLNLEDKAIISFSGDSDYFRPINYSYNGNSDNIASAHVPKTPCDIIVVYSTDFFFFEIASRAGWSNQKGAAFFYEKINTESYFGIVSNTNNANLTDFILIDSNNLQFSRPLMLNYAREVGYIDFIDYDILISANGAIFDNKGFIACSEITNNSVITFNGKNYYSLGSHSLVQLDD